MKKDKFFGFRADDDTAKFVKKESEKAKKTMSEWLRDEIKRKVKKK